MKHLLIGALGLACIAAAPQTANAKLKVFACFPEWQALVQELGGPAVEVFTAVGPLVNPDHVTVTPELLASLKSADLLICTGGGFEDEWLPSALDRVQNPKLAEGQPGRFFASDFVKTLEDDHHDGEKKEEGHLHEGGNPHIQGDPYRVRAIAGQLGKRMIELDQSDAATYSENTKTFVKDIGALAKELEKKAEPLKGVNIVAQHEHSVYLLSWLQIHSAAIVEPEVGVPPGPGDLARIIELIPADNVKFVLHAAYEDPRPSKYVTDRADVALVKVPFTVGGTEGGGPTFADFYRDSVERLLDGLAGRDRP
ncbi:MAG: metal ABC transporter substrate-binding protein [Thalassobaculaceae bacterium]|nr:metal ABC transporter substrate-binding protein [Thalassobaculaceae bacterium]